MGPGDRKDRAGRVVFVAAEMLRDSLGLAERAAYILTLFRREIDIWVEYKNVIYDVISLNYPPGKLRSKCSIKIKKYDLINKCIPWKRSRR